MSTIACTKDFSLTITSDLQAATAEYWKMDEPVFRVGSKNTIAFAPNFLGATNVPGKVNDGALLTAAQLSEMDSAALVPIAGGAGITVCLWLKVIDVTDAIGGTIQLWSIVPAFGLTGRTSVPHDLQELYLFASSGGTSDLTLAGALTSGVFAFIRCWQGVDGKVRIKVNEGATTVAAVACGLIPGGNYQFILGGLGSVPASGFVMDEVAIFERVLTDPEGAYLYNGGAGRTWPI